MLTTFFRRFLFEINRLNHNVRAPRNVWLRNALRMYRCCGKISCASSWYDRGTGCSSWPVWCGYPVPSYRRRSSVVHVGLHFGKSPLSPMLHEHSSPWLQTRDLTIVLCLAPGKHKPDRNGWMLLNLTVVSLVHILLVYYFYFLLVWPLCCHIIRQHSWFCLFFIYLNNLIYLHVISETAIKRLITYYFTKSWSNGFTSV